MLSFRSALTSREDWGEEPGTAIAQIHRFHNCRNLTR